MRSRNKEVRAGAGEGGIREHGFVLTASIRRLIIGRARIWPAEHPCSAASLLAADPGFLECEAGGSRVGGSPSVQQRWLSMVVAAGEGALGVVFRDVVNEWEVVAVTCTERRK